MPVYPFNPGADFILFDGIESVTYKSRQTGETFTSTANVKALFHYPATDEEEMSGKRVVVIHIFADELDAPAKPRDKVTREDGTEFVVNEAHLESFQSRYRLITVQTR